MRVYFSADHELRDAESELHGGRLVKPFEAPFRAELIENAVRDQGHGEILEPEKHSLETAAKLHAPDYLEFLQTAWGRWKADGYEGEAIPACFPARRMVSNKPPRDIDGALGYYSFAAETAITDGTWAAALSAMNSAISAADHVTSGAKAAFALCRPPGHHASIDQFGGYCFLNNAGIAAQHLLDSGVKKVALIDVDFHHGNGTQDIFWKRGDVFFASIHGDPLDAFPHFLGFADEKGEGEGQGATLNIPLPRNTVFDIWLSALQKCLDASVRFGAEALVISLGVDTFENDPISFFKRKSDDFTRYGAAIGRLNMPTVFCMEGGYGVPEIGLNAANVLTGFEGV